MGRGDLLRASGEVGCPRRGRRPLFVVAESIEAVLQLVACHAPVGVIPVEVEAPDGLGVAAAPDLEGEQVFAAHAPASHERGAARFAPAHDLADLAAIAARAGGREGGPEDNGEEGDEE